MKFSIAILTLLFTLPTFADSVTCTLTKGGERLSATKSLSNKAYVPANGKIGNISFGLDSSCINNLSLCQVIAEFEDQKNQVEAGQYSFTFKRNQPRGIVHHQIYKYDGNFKADFECTYDPKVANL